MQDHYFKYVCTDGKTVFFALHKSDLEAERNNDIKGFIWFLSAAFPIIMAALKQPRQSNNRCNLQGKRLWNKTAGHHKKEYVNHVQLCANFS